MNLDEQIALLAGVDAWHTAATSEVPAIRMSDGPAGVRGTSWEGPASASFPCGTALAASFDPDLVREVGRQLGREARSKSAHVLLAPTVNLQRTPIGGRNFECMSEDPLLTAAIASAYVEGVQSQGIACCVKHFVCNDTEFARLVVDVEVSERVLREVYLIPFEAAVRAGVRSVMTAYNRLNGTFCSENPWLISELLRGEWGFDGVVISDWHGTHSGVESLLAGLDIEMPGPTRHRGAALVEAHAVGAVRDGDIGASVARIGALAEWSAVSTTGTDEITADDAETRAVCRRAAAAGMVLLKNDGDVLPLGPTTRIALIGPYADTGRVQGGGSAKVRPDRPAPILSALRARGFAVDFERGCTIHKTIPAVRGDFDVTVTDVNGATHRSTPRRLDLAWQQRPAPGLDREFGASITGTFVPGVTGDWTFGFRVVGRATVRLDEVVVFDVEPATGGSFFNYGSPEMFATVPLVAAVPCRIAIEYPSAPHPGWRGLVLGAEPPSSGDAIADAVRLAAAADVALVVVGTNDQWETEGEDRTSMDLPGRQDELVATVAAVNPRTVVVLNCGSPVTMPWLDRVTSVLQIWFPGGQVGPALADVLSGDVEPGGRLPVTFPRSLDRTPAARFYPGDGARAVYGEGLLVGYRWYEHERVEPLFPFGHGLGYTTFDVTPAGLSGSPAAGVHVTADVVNTGGRPGSSVVQVYVDYAGTDPDVPRIRRFVAARKVHLVPGEGATVTIELSERMFSSWLDGGWRVGAGTHRILVGSSSRSLGEVGTIEA
ncbi:MAG TPA: glycoside hydrolase family 3 C-terminal domain-containing protein [Ilumatobacteraceae bacterium]|nr:glycoside hydrolase family 3 C-terminal domain-containing protein [Ilumatobacteraceae bacterium]